MNEVITIGVDLAKNVFQGDLVGQDEGCILATLPGLAVPAAQLPAFRGVNSV